jgi:hypothetical protein
VYNFNISVLNLYNVPYRRASQRASELLLPSPYQILTYYSLEHYALALCSRLQHILLFRGYFYINLIRLRVIASLITLSIAPLGQLTPLSVHLLLYPLSITMRPKLL